MGSLRFTGNASPWLAFLLAIGLLLTPFAVQAQDDPDEAPAQVIPGTVVVGESTCEAGVPAFGTV